MTQEDPWEKYKAFTNARIALGRAGGSLPTKDLLKFRKDHALARDAVWAEMNTFSLEHKLSQTGLKHITLSSKAENRQLYIQRPELGRELNSGSIQELLDRSTSPCDLCIVIADGLSATAIDHHAIAFLKAFFPQISIYSLATVCIVKQGRVAIGDQVGELLRAKLVVVLIGERPGLSSPDSMGIYLTYNPRKGTTDEKRNCISNIRQEGLSYPFAAQKLAFLVNEAMSKKLSGVNLKDNSNLLPDPNARG